MRWSSKWMGVLVAAGLLLPAAVGAQSSRVLAFGDSLTVGFGESGVTCPFPTFGGYPPRLTQRLADREVDAEVINRGQCLESTVTGLTRLDTVLAEGADVVILMEGTNDVSGGFNGWETAWFNLREMARKARSLGIEPMLVSPPPRNDDEDLDRAMALLAEALQEVALLDDLVLLDLYDAWDNLNFPAFYFNELHPNAEGYDRMANRLLDATIETLSREPRGPGVLAFDATPPAAVAEGAESVAVTVQRTNGAIGAVTVAYQTVDGSAAAGEDYVSTAGVLSWPDGDQDPRTIEVEILQDSLEEDDETLRIVLGEATGGAVLGMAAEQTVTIADDDSMLEPCRASATDLCLNDDRFRVTVDWENFAGNHGVGSVVPAAVSPDSGVLWFFNPNNWEFLVKVLDNCNGSTNRFWVFAAATTNVGYTLRVEDTHTGVVRLYTNPLGVAAPAITDTQAFATCP